MERRVYSSWAYTDKEDEKSKINQEIYEALKEKAQVVYDAEKVTDELQKSKTVLLDYKHGYAHTDYKVLSNPHNLSVAEMALVCDGGNLCFGFRTSGNIITIYTD